MTERTPGQPELAPHEQYVAAVKELYDKLSMPDTSPTDATEAYAKVSRLGLTTDTQTAFDGKAVYDQLIEVSDVCADWAAQREDIASADNFRKSGESFSQIKDLLYGKNDKGNEVFSAPTAPNPMRAKKA